MDCCWNSAWKCLPFVLRVLGTSFVLVSGIPAWGTREWGALSQTPLSWCGVLVPFQSRNMTCSDPRVCLSTCTHTCTHIFHFWPEGKPKVIEINRQKWKPVLLIFFNVIPCRLAHIFLKNSYTFFFSPAF